MFALMLALLTQRGVVGFSSTMPTRLGLHQRRSVELFAGFGAVEKKSKKNFIKPGKKDLERQWERYFVSCSEGQEASSIWVRVGDDWLLVGSITGGEEAFAIQKVLIGWAASELHLRVRASKTTPEFGLGPALDDDYVDEYDPATSTTEGMKIEPVVKKKEKTLTIDEVGFKPYKAFIKEHQKTLGSSLLNKSTGKGSVKFKQRPSSSAEEATPTPSTSSS